MTTSEKEPADALGDGMRLTPALSADTELTLESEHSLGEGSVEITYAWA